MRIGSGHDIHRLVEGGPLVLGGVSIAHDRELEGHSDADVLVHAVADALLGAAALGDLGRHFPDTDAQWRDADSLDLLRRVADMLGEREYRIQNVDVTVLAERPRLRPHVDRMRANVADAVRVERDRVSIKATTAEGVGPVGRGEAIEARASVLVSES